MIAIGMVWGKGGERECDKLALIWQYLGCGMAIANNAVKGHVNKLNT